MFVAFEREPLSWVHPYYRPRRQVHHPLYDWERFVQPAMETVGTLNELLQLAGQENLVRRQQQRPSDKFEVKMDVQQFSPNEIDVKMVDNCVIIEGKHEEKQDEQGYISRHFVRRYLLPDDVKPETVTCNLSSDGILCVTAPRMLEEKKTTERNVPINLTGQPAMQNEKQESIKNTEAKTTGDLEKDLIKSGKGNDVQGDESRSLPVRNAA